MRDSDVPVKTEAGRRELVERRHALQPRQRTMLISIHGEHALVDLRRQFQVLGDVDAIIAELQAAGLIEPQGAQAAEPVVAAVAEPVASTTDYDDDEPTPVQAARRFMNETAVAALGLRAFLFTLKLEKCYSKQDLEALLPEYRRVMGKARNVPFADAMVRRAQDMLVKV